MHACMRAAGCSGVRQLPRKGQTGICPKAMQQPEASHKQNSDKTRAKRSSNLRQLKQATSRTATDTRQAQRARTRSMTKRHLLALTTQGMVRFR
eukprot:15462775-Alexandrium_andersonii.AAC.1